MGQPVLLEEVAELLASGLMEQMGRDGHDNRCGFDVLHRCGRLQAPKMHKQAWELRREG